MKAFSDFARQKDLLICVDSDGCAMDSMNIKHFFCFGPCMIKEWGLERWQDKILRHWNEINLYTITRGVNRFKGLAQALCEINDRYCLIDGVDELKSWTDSALELSNSALEKLISSGTSSHIFKKVLNWSKSVNEEISNLPEDRIVPFPMVNEALQIAHKHADVAVVSSANPSAVLQEWKRHGLINQVDVVMTQNDGSKADCINRLLGKGYINIKVVMCGDAIGDLDAANKNGVFFFPILMGKEAESWEEFISEGLPRLMNGSFGGEYQHKKIKEFYENLGE